MSTAYSASPASLAIMHAYFCSSCSSTVSVRRTAPLFSRDTLPCDNFMSNCALALRRRVGTKSNVPSLICWAMPYALKRGVAPGTLMSGENMKKLSSSKNAMPPNDLFSVVLLMPFQF